MRELRTHASTIRPAAFAVGLVVLLTTVAGAATVTFDESGYSAGGLNGQQASASTAAWSGTNGFEVAAGIGAGASNGVTTNASLTQYSSNIYVPSAAEMANIPFNASSSKVAFSIDIRLAASDVSGSIVRVYIGVHPTSTATNAITLTIYGNGNCGTGAYSANSSGGLLSDNNYHTFSGTFDFGAKTYNLFVDGDQKVTNGAFDGSGTSTYTNYGGVKLNAPATSATYATNTVQFDNIEYNPVPEPASMALLGAGGLAMLRHKR